MRILFATHHGSRVAGAETYVATAIAALIARGHDVVLLAERAPVRGREPIAGGQARWCADAIGEAAALAEARRWAPDVVYVQGLASERLEDTVLGLAPAVLFAHAYAGLCISGSRTWQSSDTCCPRALGPACLAHYFPHRCGGRSPLTLIRDYARQVGARNRHARYRAIVVASSYMAGLFAPHTAANRLHVLPPPVPPPVRDSPRSIETPIRIVYAGRLERLKGVHLLVGGAHHAAERTDRRLELRIAGDGPLRGLLEGQAGRLSHRNLQVTLDGWQAAGARDALFATADLVVMPSLWPEPYGLSGLEAARFGVPAVAFDSGGIPEWLHEGVNGVLASDRTEQGLAGAIAATVGDAQVYRTLSSGALRAAAAASPDAHASGLERVFEEALR